MEIGSLLLILALLMAVAWFIARPLFDRKTAMVSALPDQQDHEVSALMAERDRILDALQELDFDHALGKIPEEDYPIQRAALLQRGAATLRLIDELTEQASEADLESRIEAAVMARRTDGAQLAVQSGDGNLDELGESAPSPATVGVLEADDEVEAILASRRRARQDKLSGFCPQCGRPVQKSDRFCPRCGKSLA